MKIQGILNCIERHKMQVTLRFMSQADSSYMKTVTTIARLASSILMITGKICKMHYAVVYIVSEQGNSIRSSVNKALVKCRLKFCTNMLLLLYELKIQIRFGAYRKKNKQ